MSEPLALRLGREFPAGHVLFREGEEGTSMYVVQSGLVRIRRRVVGGERTVAILGHGEFLGELALLNGKPRTGTAIVIEAARCLVLDSATLEQMIAQSPDVAHVLMKRLARRLDSAEEMVQLLLNPDPQARVLLGLKRYVENLGEGPTGEGRAQVTATGLALQVGVDEARVAEVLARLERLRIAESVPGPETQAMTVTLNFGRLLEFLEFLETPRKLEG